MFNIVVAVVVALLIWWGSTGIILALDGLPRSTYSKSMAVATGLLGLALAGVVHIRNDVTAMGAYVGFGCGIMVWAWLEMSFLMGYVTGSRKHACPAGCGGWRHFGHAVQAILYHETAIVALGLIVL